MIKHSLFMLAVAAALSSACNNKNIDAKGVNANAGPRPQDSATASRAGGAEGSTQGAAIGTEDRQFVREAAAGGRQEVELGRLAQQHGSSEEVKQLGRRIADDHERTNRELEAMLGQADVAHAAGGSADDVRRRLERMSGEDFDRAYVEQTIDDHQKDIKEFERAARSSSPPVRVFAETTLPILREHLGQAHKAQAALKK